MARSISKSEQFSDLNSMELYRKSEFERILGPIKLMILRDNQYPLKLVYDYHMGNLKGNNFLGAHNNMLGYEFQAYEVERLINLGIKNKDIIMEKDIGTTKVDIFSNFTIPIPYNYVNLDGSSSLLHLLGQHNIECKACSTLHWKAVTQVEKALQFFKNSSGNHVLVLKDSVVEYEKNKAIHDLGGTVLKSDITRKGLENRLEETSRKVKAI